MSSTLVLYSRARQSTTEHASARKSTSMHARARQCTPEHASARQSTQVHANAHLMALHWLPIKSRIVFKILVLTFHCLHGSAPAYLSELIKPYSPASQSRSETSTNLLCIPRIRLEKYGARSFSHAAPTLWNKLPEDIRAINSMSLFRSRLKTHLFKIAYM